MSLYVVDASVAVKLYVPEIHSEHAVRFFSDQHHLMVPDIMLSELGNVIWKKVSLLGELSADEGKRIISAARNLPLVYFSTTDLLPDAFQMALDTKRTLYDCLYVTLAAGRGCQLMTDDRKLYRALQLGSLNAVPTLIENYQSQSQ